MTGILRLVLTCCLMAASGPGSAHESPMTYVSEAVVQIVAGMGVSHLSAKAASRIDIKSPEHGVIEQPHQQGSAGILFVIVADTGR